MNTACAICLELPTTPPLITPCAHHFCIECLQNWQRRQPSCPVCREPLRLPPQTTLRQPPASVAPRQQRQQHLARDWAGNSPALADERSVARQRRSAFETRLRSYHGMLHASANRECERNPVFTPSGRPYDSLPVISLSRARQLDAENRRALYGGLYSSRLSTSTI